MPALTPNRSGSPGRQPRGAWKDHAPASNRHPCLGPTFRLRGRRFRRRTICHCALCLVRRKRDNQLVRLRPRGFQGPRASDPNFLTRAHPPTAEGARHYGYHPGSPGHPLPSTQTEVGQQCPANWEQPRSRAESCPWLAVRTGRLEPIEAKQFSCGTDPSVAVGPASQRSPPKGTTPFRWRTGTRTLPRGARCFLAGGPPTHRAPGRTCSRRTQPHQDAPGRTRPQLTAQHNAPFNIGRRAHKSPHALSVGGATTRLSTSSKRTPPHWLGGPTTHRVPTFSLRSLRGSFCGDHSLLPRRTRPRVEKCPGKEPFVLDSKPNSGLSQGCSTPIRNHSDCRHAHTHPHLEPAGNLADSRGAVPSRDTRPRAAPLRHATPTAALADATGSGRLGIVSIDARFATFAHCPAR